MMRRQGLGYRPEPFWVCGCCTFAGTQDGMFTCRRQGPGYGHEQPAPCEMAIWTGSRHLPLCGSRRVVYQYLSEGVSALYPGLNCIRACTLEL